MSLKNKKVLVGLTGGIACYKVPYLVRMLSKEGADVRVIMTLAATKFITPLTMETVSKNPVAENMFPPDRFVATRHIDLAEWPDLIVVAPATANFMGKIASGVSDDLLTTIICASSKPVMIAPSMNPRMWSNRITQKNYTFLKEYGYMFIEPTEGDMACDHFGVGRMAEPEQLFEAIKPFFSKGYKQDQPLPIKKKTLKSKKVLITAGPTREAIDPVRYLSNYSSGKMGYALAEAASLNGAETTLISGPTNIEAPQKVKIITIESTEELFHTVKKEFKKADCLIMAAAPADYMPEKKAPRKIKKSNYNYKLTLNPTVDILKEISSIKQRSQFVVGFALETENGISNARKKLKEKKLDMIILNQPGANSGFESETNKVTVLRPHEEPIEIPLMTKQKIAAKLLDIILEML